MYVTLGSLLIDTKEVINKIESYTDFQVIKDMSKGTKREDVIAINLSVSIDILNQVIEEDYDLSELEEEDLFEEYLSLTEEMILEFEEHIPKNCIIDAKAYKWDQSADNIKAILIIVNEDFGDLKLSDIIKRLLKQVE